MAEVLSDRVRSVISLSGETQEAFGKLVGLDATKLSKSLSGIRRFTSLELARIADAGGVTVDWLINGESINAESLAARVSHDATIEKAVSEGRRLAEARDNLIRLSVPNACERPPQAKPGTRWIDQGQSLAEFALQFLGEPNVLGSSESFASAIEASFSIDVRAFDLDEGCDGLALSTPRGARVMVVNSSGNPTRQRFTMAHELAHLLEGDSQSLHIDRNVMATRKEGSEVRANAFAACLLMPERLLVQRFYGRTVTKQDFSNVVMELMVSPSSLAWRLLNLNLVDDARRRELGALRTVDCAAVADRMSEYASWVEDSSQERIPIRLLRDALQVYVEGKSTLRPVSNLVGIELDLLRRVVDSATATATQDESVDFVP